MTVIHPFQPVYNDQSRVLILGTMASKASRDSGFYYGHPRNRFWPLIAALYNAPTPVDIDAKKALLLRNGVALWDVLRSCDIKGAADHTIENPCANTFDWIFAASPNLRVFANGQTAAKLYRDMVYPHTGVPIVPLPSTSPANASWTWERLVEAWRVIVDITGSE